MAKKGEALTRLRPAPIASRRAPTAPGAKRPANPSGPDPLNRLVAACVGAATLAGAVGVAWRDGHGAAPGGHSLMSGLEIDLTAGASALGLGLWMAARHRRRIKDSMARVVEALSELAADPDPERLKPLEVEGDMAALALAYNELLIGLGRRERQLTIQAMAKAEQRRLSELTLLRQHISSPVETAKGLALGAGSARETVELSRRRRRIGDALARVGDSVLAALDDLIHAAPSSYPIQTEPVDLAELADDVGALFWSQAAAKGLDLAVYVDPQTPPQIQSDPVRLRQILGGLAGSAIAATDEGGVLIEIEPDSPTTVRISVHDTGPALTRAAPRPAAGVDDEAGDVRAGDPNGTLSARLAAYRRLVQAMGGAFAAPARRDRGASLSFRLPAPAEAVPSSWAAAPPRTAETAAEATASNPRVMIAVRGPCTRRALSRYLARAGLGACVYEGAAPSADVRLLIGDAHGLKAVGPLDIPVVRLVTPEALMASNASPMGDAAAATLSLPLCRAEVEALLRRVNRGQSVTAAGSGQAAFEDVGRLSPAVAASGDTALSEDERTLLADLDRAAEREELSLVYQPQVDRESERILGVEALLRWTHPTRGSVSPNVFIPLAEKTGRIAEVTGWVIKRVLAETHYLSGLHVSFNASALEFAQRGFVDRLLAAVAECGYDARRLEVEITETAILHHETPVRDSMDRLHAAGIGVALDDFGAGYSSLSHLRRYPFDKLKIDREFITDCSRHMESATVVHAVVSIGRALGMKVIAEGVETQTQRNFLRIAGVYAMQGYLFGKPVPIDNLSPLLSAGRAQAKA